MAGDEFIRVIEGCPTHVGIGLALHPYQQRPARLPHTRGDRPIAHAALNDSVLVAPHTWG